MTDEKQTKAGAYEDSLIITGSKTKPKKTDDRRIEYIKEFQSPNDLYQGLIRRVHKYHPSDDISMIDKAYATACEAHKDQVRKSGEPYIIHPLCVAIILADLELDKETIIAGLLHDVVEDTIMTNEELKEQFGPDVELLVDGVTKLEQLQYTGEAAPDRQTSREELQAENLRKMFLAMAKDIRVILIKLADRLHNMRTLKYKSPESQKRIARETLDIYSPLAERLGISKIKIELDDLSLKYLEADAYYDLVEKIALKKDAREKYVQDIVDEVSEHITSAGIEAQIDGRVKHFFSIYKKMKNQDKTIDQIYDLFAVRIIVNSVKDCYAALGVIHEMYKPMPGRFKDYIAMPKANMYQSLHTTLIGSTGTPFEIQIRTYEMHRVAEYGIAAHWKYKEASDGKVSTGGEEAKLAWLSQILEWQKDMSDNREFMNLLKSDLDLFSDHVYCFTPSGDVKNLPAGSTPIDFAYSVHSAVGNKMIGARVNGKLVTIDYQIGNGDCIEIMTSQNSKGPSRDWLNIVKSAQAKTKIMQWFKNEFKEDNIIKGRELIHNYCKSKSINIIEIVIPEYQSQIMRKYGFKNWEAVLAAIGHGALKEGQIINRMQELYARDHKKQETNEDLLTAIQETIASKPMKPRGRNGITVKGIHDVAVRFSRCCAPVPGDEIVGFVTRGRGVSIHRTDCINILNLSDLERSRLIDAEWEPEITKDQSEKYLAEIVIYAHDRSGLLADVSKALTEKNIDIRSVNTRTNKQNVVTMDMAFEIGNGEELRAVIDKIRMIESVIDIERTAG